MWNDKKYNIDLIKDFTETWYYVTQHGLKRAPARKNTNMFG
jgi:hypothetical protein